MRTRRDSLRKQKKVVPTPGSAVLIRDLHHVLYEINMMWEAVSRLPTTSRGSFEQNAFLESFVIHARALLEFFSDKPKLDTDSMRASDFVPGFPAAATHPDHKRMHKEVGHLTFARKGRDEKREWNAAETAKPILERSLAFLLAVQRDTALTSDEKTKDELQKLVVMLRNYFESLAFVAQLAQQPYLSSSSAPTVLTTLQVDQHQITFREKS